MGFRTELTDQRIPTRLLQFAEIAEKAIERMVGLGKMSTEGLRATHFRDGTGRYLRFGDRHGVGASFGIDLSMWRTEGRTPLWVQFMPGAFGHGEDVGPLLQVWSRDSNRAVLVLPDGQASVGVDLETGVERDEVIDGVVGQLTALQEVLVGVPRTSDEAVPDEAKA